MNEVTTPWYRQFWPWFLILLPASVVVAGITTVVIAMRSSDSVVSDQYYREGMAINRVMARDRRAAELGLSADIQLRGRVLSVDLNGDLAPLPTALQVFFKHPLQADEDFSLPMSRIAAATYTTTLPRAVAGRWYVELLDMQSEWRLQGEAKVDPELGVALTLEADDG